MAYVKRTATNRSTGKKTTTTKNLVPIKDRYPKVDKNKLSPVKDRYPAADKSKLSPIRAKSSTGVNKDMLKSIKSKKNPLSTTSARKEQIAVKNSKRKVY